MTTYNIIDQRFTQTGLTQNYLFKKNTNRVKSILKTGNKNEHGDTQCRPTIIAATQCDDDNNNNNNNPICKAPECQKTSVAGCNN